MMPLTTSMDICGSFFEIASTKPMEAMAPRKAARTIPQEFMISPCPRNRIMKIETTSLAPEETPARTDGPAMGLESTKEGLQQKSRSTGSSAPQDSHGAIIRRHPDGAAR